MISQLQRGWHEFHSRKTYHISFEKEAVKEERKRIGFRQSFLFLSGRHDLHKISRSEGYGLCFLVGPWLRPPQPEKVSSVFCSGTLRYVVSKWRLFWSWKTDFQVVILSNCWEALVNRIWDVSLLFLSSCCGWITTGRLQLTCVLSMSLHCCGYIVLHLRKYFIK